MTLSGPGGFQFGIFLITLIILSFVMSILSRPSSYSNSFLTSFNHSACFWCSFLSLHIPLQNVCAFTEFEISYWWFSSSLFNRWKNRPGLLTNIRFCWYWFIREMNHLIFAPTALIRCFIFFPYKVESRCSNIVSSFQPIFMFLLNISFLK